MRVLGIETSTRRASVAVLHDDEVMAEVQVEGLGAHAERILGLIDEALTKAGVRRGEIARIGVGVGPGSFTGLRVGLSVGRGMARGLGIPVLGVGSLHALACARFKAQPSQRPLIAVLDARREELFAQVFDSDLQAITDPAAIHRQSVQGWLDALGVRDPFFVGEGAALLGQPSDGGLPGAVEVAWLTARADSARSPASPLYVRDAGATPQRLPPSPFR